jgi:hypothetical protein
MRTEEGGNTMEMTPEKWKEGIIFEDNHKGYDIVIKFFENDNHYCSYVKVPKNHRYNGIDYHDIDIKVHGGLTFSDKIEDDWWIGWDYGHYFDINKYELLDVFMDCCYVIMQLIENGSESSISHNNSVISKKMSNHIANIIAKKTNMDMEIDMVNKCIICGKPTFNEKKLEQITNISRKKTNIDKETDRVFSSDPQKAIKLINKIKRYEREVKKIENTEVHKNICDACDAELSMKDIIELLKLFKEHHLIASIIENTLFSIFYCRINKCGDEDYNIYDDEDYNIYKETINNLKDNLHDKKLYEYYKAELLLILKYYDKALVSFQNLFDNHKQIKEFDIRLWDYENKLTEEELNNLNELEQFKNEIINSIPQEINKIKEILGID